MSTKGPEELHVGQALKEVLSLQAEWSKENTPAMSRRGVLVLHVIPTLLHGALAQLIAAPTAVCTPALSTSAPPKMSAPVTLPRTDCK